MRYIEVGKSLNLQGTVRIQGSKNSSLALMAATCLSSGQVILDNIPNISDVHTFLDILRNMGAKAGFVDENRIIIDPEGIKNPTIVPTLTQKVRPSYYFIGSIIAQHKKIKLGYPGGDRIGKRPIDQHIKGFEAMGAHFEFFNDCYTVTTDKLKGAEIYFDVITGGATLNAMMAAVLAKGRTILYNASRDPEVVDTAMLLNKMGAKIRGAGTSTIRIDGVKSLTGCSHAAIPDRLVAGTYLIAPGISGGCITVENVIPEHVQPLIHKLTETGMFFKVSHSSITAMSDGNIKPVNIEAEKFPMFETDFQQPAAALLLKAKGKSLVTDKIYPNRSNHCDQLRKLGADIQWKNGKALIKGGNPLVGARIHAGDIRAGASLVLAGLLAEGTTQITGIEHLERGYISIAGDLSSLGASVRIVNEECTDNEKGETCSLKNAATK